MMFSNSPTKGYCIETLIMTIKKQGVSETSLFKGLNIDYHDFLTIEKKLDNFSMLKLWLKAVSLTKNENLNI